MPAYYMRELDDEPALDPRDLMDVCPSCEGTGWKEVHGDDHDGYGYCGCVTGQQMRQEAHALHQHEWQAANDAGLWDHPEDWPW